MIGFVSSPRFIEHDTGPSHPERPDRIRAVHRCLRDAGLLDSPDPFPDFKLVTGLSPAGGPKLVEIDPVPVDDRWLLAVHPQAHLDRVRKAVVHGSVLDQGDTPTEPRSDATARLAAGASVVACDAVISGDVKRCFVAARPPGHHAEPDRAMGFCLYNNVAVAARYLQRHHGLGKIAIVDFDVHHGNGTQAVFEQDPTVLFVSLHQHPKTCYPGSGYEYETGVGNVVNLPIQPGNGDDLYLSTFDRRVIPAVERFRPDALLISAGFDAHELDPLAQMRVTEDGFERMTGKLAAVADAVCGGRVVSLLEGGYHLQAMGRSVVRHVVGLRG